MWIWVILDQELLVNQTSVSSEVNSISQSSVFIILSLAPHLKCPISHLLNFNFVGWSLDFGSFVNLTVFGVLLLPDVEFALGLLVGSFKIQCIFIHHVIFLFLSFKSSNCLVMFCCVSSGMWAFVLNIVSLLVMNLVMLLYYVFWALGSLEPNVHLHNCNSLCGITTSACVTYNLESHVCLSYVGSTISYLFLQYGTHCLSKVCR